MTSLTLRDRTGRTWVRLSWRRGAAWASMLVPVLVAVGALQAAAPARPLWPALLLLVLVLGTGLAPDSSAGLVTIGGFVAWWIYAVPPRAVGWALVAAIALLAFHQAVALAAAGPRGVAIPREVPARLVGRLVLVSAATGAVAALAWAAAGRFTSPAVVAGATLLAVGLLAAVLTPPLTTRGRGERT